MTRTRRPFIAAVAAALTLTLAGVAAADSHTDTWTTILTAEALGIGDRTINSVAAPSTGTSGALTVVVADNLINVTSATSNFDLDVDINGFAEDCTLGCAGPSQATIGKGAATFQANATVTTGDVPGVGSATNAATVAASNTLAPVAFGATPVEFLDGTYNADGTAVGLYTGSGTLTLTTLQASDFGGGYSGDIADYVASTFTTTVTVTLTNN